MSKRDSSDTEPNSPSAGLRVGFIGDISFNDKYVELYKQSVDPFENLKSRLFTAKHVVGNLECLAKGDQGENLLKKPRLTTTAETLNFLANINVTVACLAQNHIYDHLEDGFEKTLAVLSARHIRHLGAGLSSQEASAPLILSENGITLGLLNYVTSDTHPNLPPNAGVCLNIFDLQKAIADITNLKSKVDHVVVLLHWGGRVEGGLFPDFDQPLIARRLIDAGAGLIIGHHSHTFQPVEIYKGKYIFYSLGNFCFSDFTFEGKSVVMPMRRKITGIPVIVFQKDNYTVSIRFFRNDGTSFHPMPSYQRQLNFRSFIHRNFLKYYVFWKIYFLHKQYVLPLSLFLLRKDISLIIKLNRIVKSILKRTGIN